MSTQKLNLSAAISHVEVLKREIREREARSARLVGLGADETRELLVGFGLDPEEVVAAIADIHRMEPQLRQLLDTGYGSLAAMWIEGLMVGIAAASGGAAS